MRRVVQFFWGPADPRTYALVRIFLAFAGLVNLIDLWPHRYEYCAATGMISLSIIHKLTQGGLYTSVFFWVTSERGVDAVFLVAATALVTLGLGLFTRASAALVFAWHVSYSIRAFPVLHSWDAVLRVYSFIILISPSARVWSLTHWLSSARSTQGTERTTSPKKDDGDDVPIYGVRLMQWQLFVIYLMTFWLKAPDPFWRNGQLLAYFSVSLYSRTPDDLLMVRHEWISAVTTYASLAIEVSVPWLLSFRRTRAYGMLAGFALHAMIAATAKLGVFSISMIPPYMAFLDRGNVDWLVQRARTVRARLGRRAAPSGAGESS
ncbi:MAG TPA: HTTM domain-containing protein [Polyangiaceae bacterium]|nr:HTTM domain-containing protein [Polyangiaceae bacterium]